MAAVDLSDHDIDQLLSSAELSLASKQADQAVALNGKQQSLTLAPKAPPPSTMLVGKAGKETGDKPELALRVPQLKSDKKVRARAHPIRFSYEEILSQTRMTRRRAPVMGTDPATSMIFFVHSYSEDHLSFLCVLLVVSISSLTGRTVCSGQCRRRVELHAAHPD